MCRQAGISVPSWTNFQSEMHKFDENFEKIDALNAFKNLRTFVDWMWLGENIASSLLNDEPFWKWIFLLFILKIIYKQAEQAVKT